MRTNEPTESQPWRPLGEKVQAPPPPAPKDKPVQGSTSSIVVGPDGRMRTTNHKG